MTTSTESFDVAVQRERDSAATQALPSDTALAGVNLQKSYGGRKVVDDVSLHVERGEVVGLLGANGAGKTTTFYMIVGLERPDAGVVSLGERDVTQAADVSAGSAGCWLPSAGAFDLSQDDGRAKYSGGPGNDGTCAGASGSLDWKNCWKNLVSHTFATQKVTSFQAASGGAPR